MKKAMIQKVLSMVLAVLLMLGIIPMSGLAESDPLPAFRYGDVNGDGEIDAKDALEVLKAAVNKITLTEQQTKAADVDGNGTLDAADALYILKYSVDKIEEFPVETAKKEADKAAAQAVESKITAIGVVTLDSEAAIAEARAAYEALTDDQKELVTKLDILVSAEGTLAQLKAEPTVFDVHVTDTAYGAKGDGKTNDRAAIQAAIDGAYAAGGGTVRLDAGKTFVSGNLVMRSNVTLNFEDGAILKQSANPKDFVKPSADGTYEPSEPLYGHDYTSANWGHASYYNYPLIFAGQNTSRIKICGYGTIEMTRGSDCNNTMHMCPIGMYGVSNFEISDITIQKYNAYAIHPYNSDHGLLKGITVKDPTDGNGDGFSMANCQDMHITGCDLTTSDDGIYIYSVYNDPRTGITWNSTENPLPSRNYEIDNNHCVVTWDETKAFAFIAWGANCPDQRQVEISNVYIHDNYFETMGAWTGYWGESEFDFNGKTSPMKNIRFENNEIGFIQSNFYSLPVSDFYGFDAMTTIKNGDFETTGNAWWLTRSDTGSSAGVKDDSVGQQGDYYGYLDGLDKGDAALYQGIHLNQAGKYQLNATVQTSGDPVRLFVKDQITQELITSQEFSNTAWEQVSFTFQVPTTGTYHIGIERGNATKGWAYMDTMSVMPVFDDIAGEPDGSTLLTNQLPTETSNGGGFRNELGIRFTPKVDGTITKARLYTCEQESGVHYVSVWDYATGILVSSDIYEWDIVSGYEGWREFALPQSVTLKAGKEYVLSVSAGPDCLFVVNKSMNTVIENNNLITPATSGISTANALTDFHKMPTNVIDGWTFLRDVVFVPDEVPTEPDVQEVSFFNNQTGYTLDVGGDGVNRNELGIRFTPKVNGSITKARVYVCAQESGIHYVSVWDYATGTLVSDSIYEWNISGGTEGWLEFTLPVAVNLTAGTEYVLSVSAGPDTKFVICKTMNTALENQYLVTPDTHGMSSKDANIEFKAMPTNIINGWSFLRDVVFVPAS